MSRDIQIYINEQLEHAIQFLITATDEQPVPAKASYNTIFNTALEALHKSIKAGHNPIPDDETARAFLDKYYVPTTNFGSNKHIVLSVSTKLLMNEIGQYVFDHSTFSMKIRKTWNMVILSTIAVGWLYESYQERVDKWIKQHQST